MLVGYVVGTQMAKTVKVRVPFEVFLPKFQKSILRHKNYFAHDETGQCLVGDVVRIVKTPRFSLKKTHAVSGFVKKADRYVDPQTNYVYTSGHLNIPVGVVDAQGALRNRVSPAEYKQMGLL
jgi:small subunit ribosomal protein S17